MHLVVTPCRDEVSVITNLIKSVSEQTVVPDSWIIVLHNYSQKRKEEIEVLISDFDWISIHQINDNSEWKRGEQIAKIVNFGISQSNLEWDFLSKIDSDVELPPNYFESIFSEFTESPDLGIASGSCYVLERGRKIRETVSPDHTRGALKTYRKKCYEDIGGIGEVNGWDGIDNIKAQMNGWITKNFPRIEARHFRRTGAYSGLVWGCFEAGQFSYSMRYLPAYIFARSLHRMSRKPAIIGGLAMFTGYVAGFTKGLPASCDPEVYKFLRMKQKRRLLFKRDVQSANSSDSPSN